MYQNMFTHVKYKQFSFVSYIQKAKNKSRRELGSAEFRDQIGLTRLNFLHHLACFSLFPTLSLLSPSPLPLLFHLFLSYRPPPHLWSPRAGPGWGALTSHSRRHSPFKVRRRPLGLRSGPIRGGRVTASFRSPAAPAAQTDGQGWGSHRDEGAGGLVGDSGGRGGA